MYPFRLKLAMVGYLPLKALSNRRIDAVFSYQWVSNDGNANTEIEDATDSTYELSNDDVGKTIRVRVSFTDDAGTRSR